MLLNSRPGQDKKTATIVHKFMRYKLNKLWTVCWCHFQVWPFHHISWRACGFVSAGLQHLGGTGWIAGDPWEVLQFDAQHWQLYIPGMDSAEHGHDKTGQLCNIPLAFQIEADCPPFSVSSFSAPQHPTPALAETLPGVSYRIHSSQMQTVSPPLPLSPQSTLRNHQPCQVQADPAALRATVAPCHPACTGHHSARDLITEQYKRSVERFMVWRQAHAEFQGY